MLGVPTRRRAAGPAPLLRTEEEAPVPCWASSPARHGAKGRQVASVTPGCGQASGQQRALGSRRQPPLWAWAREDIGAALGLYVPCARGLSRE